MSTAPLDFRSDTVTTPTGEMYEAAAAAPLGDDVHGDDPTVIKLEKLAAEKLRRDAALFVPSGIMGNLLALGVHARGGGEALMEEMSHTFNFEGGGTSRVWGVHVRTLKSTRGAMNPDDVRDSINAATAHTPATRVVSIENTHNFHGGAVVPLDNIKAVSGVAKSAGLKVHVDGARIMNASVASGVPPAEYAAHADSVMFCLSKGLSAPLGSMLVGDSDFIAEARLLRRMIGGGMRQAGVIAAMGIVALERMVDRLAEDHENAKKLARGLAEIDGVVIDPEDVQTNIVIFSLGGGFPSCDEALLRLKAEGLLVTTMAGRVMRMVTHRGVDSDDVDAALGILRSAVPAMRG